MIDIVDGEISSIFVSSTLVSQALRSMTTRFDDIVYDDIKIYLSLLQTSIIFSEDMIVVKVTLYNYAMYRKFLITMKFLFF